MKLPYHLTTEPSEVETIDGDIGLQCLNVQSLRSICQACALSDKGSAKQMVERLRKWYQSH